MSAPAADNRATNAKAANKKTPFSVKFSIFMLLVTAGVFFPSTVILCAGMLPTFVAAIVDDSQKKTAWVTVGVLNFSGVLPVWLELFERGHRIDVAINLMLDPQSLLMCYGAAMVGYVIYHQLPYFITGIVAKRGEKRLKDIDKRKKELARKWGAEVSGENK